MATSSTVRMAGRNLWRNPKRTGLALVSLATAQAAVLFYSAVMTAYEDWTLKSITGPLVGHVQVHAPKWRKEHGLDQALWNANEKLAQARRLPEVHRVSARLYAPALVAVGEEGQAAMVLGIDPALESGESGMLGENPAAAALPPGEALVGATFAQARGIRPGDVLAIVSQAADGSVANELFRVHSLVNSRVDLVNRQGVLLWLEDARTLFALPEAAHELVVHVKDPALAPAVAQKLEALPEFAGDEVLPWDRLAPELAALVEVVGAYEVFIVLLFFVAAAAGVANTLMMATFERTREFGMLLALGARPWRMVRLVLSEAVLLGLWGLVAGTLFGVGLVAWSSHHGLDLGALAGEGRGGELSFAGLRWTMVVFPRLEPKTLVRALAAVFATSVVASLWPAARAARLKPVEALRS